MRRFEACPCSAPPSRLPRLALLLERLSLPVRRAPPRAA
eukprot:SAG11_NODE_34697_length_270_cov_1.192982_1_plen_38_part_10